MSQIQFSEDGTGFVKHEFTDKEGDPITPDSATYTLYNKKTKAIINLRTDVSIPNLAQTVDLEITDADNIIIDDTLDIEQHVLFVKWVYNTDKKDNEEHIFDVINRVKIT